MIEQITHGDCLEIMPQMNAESIDSIVTDPPYGIKFMGKDWDAPHGMLGHLSQNWSKKETHSRGYADNDNKAYQAWSTEWATEALRVAKPGAYLLSFGGTRTVHRLACAIEDAGWSIRDLLVWGYASGFPKGRANLKPAWEPIVMARKPGPLQMLNIDECRIEAEPWTKSDGARGSGFASEKFLGDARGINTRPFSKREGAGRWPANVILTDSIFDGDLDGVLGGELNYSRFFIVSKANRSDREPVLGGLELGFSPTMGNGIGGREHDPKNTKAYRANVHPTVKPIELMRHLVRLITPKGGIVLDPFLGSGTTGLAAEMEGFAWIGIEKEAEYITITKARLNGTQKGLEL